MDIYCVKCRKKVHATDARPDVVTFTRKKTGKQGQRHSLSATCPHCGITMKRFIKAGEGAAAAPAETETE